MRVFLSSFKQKFGYLQSAISTSPIGYALQEWIYPNISSAWRRSTPLGINTLPETSLTLQSEHSPLRQHTLTLTPARSSAHKMDSLHFASIILSPTLSLKTSVAQFLRQTRFVLNVLACAEHLAADIGWTDIERVQSLNTEVCHHLRTAKVECCFAQIFDDLAYAVCIDKTASVAAFCVLVRQNQGVGEVGVGFCRFSLCR